MFRKLRVKIVVAIMSVLTVLFVGILLTIYLFSYHKSVEYTERALKKLCKDNGFDVLNKPKKGKIYYLDSYYLVFVGNDYEVQKISNNAHSGLTDEELGDLAVTIIQKKSESGTLNSLTYFSVVRKKGTYVAFTNDSLQIDYFETLFYTIVIFGGLGLLLLLLLSVWLSGWLVSPVEAVFKKQKQFISDASHELKTPLAIISSNVDALERDNGESKWLGYIRTETIRMNGLVTDLLQLATIDSNEDRSVYVKLNFSETVMSNVLPFESVAFENEIELEEQIEDDIYFVGDGAKLGQLTVILLDNAINHTDPGGKVTVSLKQQRDKKVLSVSNTGKEIPISEQELIFERFYRADEARTREQGRYGLGLSIAKSITQNHNGKISITCKNNITTFKVIL